MEIDEGRLRQQLRDCIRWRVGPGESCRFEEALGSCYDCSWGHALEFVIGVELFDQWHAEIMAELRPEIDACQESIKREWRSLTAASVGLMDLGKAEEVSVATKEE